MLLSSSTSILKIALNTPGLLSSDTLYNVNVRLNHIVAQGIGNSYNLLLLPLFTIFLCSAHSLILVASYMQPYMQYMVLFISRVFYARHFRQFIRSVSALYMLKLTYFYSILPLCNTVTHTVTNYIVEKQIHTHSPALYRLEH